MSSDYYRKQAQQQQAKLAQLQKDKSRLVSKASDALIKAKSARQGATRSTNASTAQSKHREAQRYDDEYAKHQKDLARLELKMSDELKRKGEAERNQQKDEKREADALRQKHDREDREREVRSRRLEITTREHETHLHRVRNTLQGHAQLHRTAFEAIERLSHLPEKITVLFMASNPLDQKQLRLDEEARAIEEMIHKAKHRESVIFRTQWAARPMDILQAVNEYDPSIVHFSGHGSVESELAMQGNHGETRLVSKEAIAASLATCSENIQVVFFNTCYSREQAEAVVKHVSAAIGMKTSIGDEAARVFSSQFYSAIGFGHSVRKAFDQARAALMLENILEEDTPELFHNPAIDPGELFIVKP